MSVQDYDHEIEFRLTVRVRVLNDATEDRVTDQVRRALNHLLGDFFGAEPALPQAPEIEVDSAVVESLVTYRDREVEAFKADLHREQQAWAQRNFGR